MNDFPLNATETDKRSEKTRSFDGAAFYDALASVVQVRGLSWRQVARETGIHPSTLSRMGQGRASDAASLAVLAAWAGINPADFVQGPAAPIGVQSRPGGLAPLVAIAGLLKADLNLQPEAARALERIIRIAYERFKQQRA